MNAVIQFSPQKINSFQLETLFESLYSAINSNKNKKNGDNLKNDK